MILNNKNKELNISELINIIWKDHNFFIGICLFFNIIDIIRYNMNKFVDDNLAKYEC